MTLGTAIFLSSLVLGGVVLYWLTRDRVHWGQLLRWIAVLILICIVAFAVATAIYLTPFFWRGAVDELGGFRIGDTEADILFKNSNYERVCEGQWKGLEAKVYFFFERSCETLSRVELNGGSVRSIGRSSYGYDQISWPYRNPLLFGSSLKAIKSDLGKEDFFREHSDRSRTYVYTRLNLALTLRNDRLISVKVFDPQVHYSSSGEEDEVLQGECFTKDGAKMQGGWKTAFRCEASTP
jgi:hypothetical protein